MRLQRFGRSGAGPRLHCSFVLAWMLGALPAVASAQATEPAADRQIPAAVGSTPEPAGYFGDLRLVDRGIATASRRLHLGGNGNGETKDGFYPELSNLPTGSGWISVGPGYRQRLFDDRALFDVSAALSWRSYKMAQARFEAPKIAGSRVTVGTQVRWQDLTQVTYFGEGSDSLESQRSEYRLKSTNVVAFATLRGTSWLSIGGKAGWLDRPSILSPSGSFARGNPDARDIFPDDIVYSIAQQPGFLHQEASVTADTRDHRSHTSSGGVYRAAAANFADRDAGQFSFRRFELEGAQFVPVSDSRIVFALHGWLVTSDTSNGDVVPFYLQPSLGGGNTVRAYTDFRFHDRNLVVCNVESRVALFAHIDATLFADAGNVASRVGDLNLDKRAYGFGLRFHTHESTFARIEMAHGDDGWRFIFRMNDPLHFSRLSRRTAPIPFVP